MKYDLVWFGTLVAVVFGRDVIRLLFSETYLPCYVPFVLLMVGLVLKVTENTLGYSLVAIGDSDKPLIVNAVRVRLRNNERSRLERMCCTPRAESVPAPPS
jgi:O-antigen/teichoic acid export membrane protein